MDWWLILLLPTFLAVWFLLPYAWRRWQERRLAALCYAHRLLVLTYDDGPGTTLTARLLELLKAHDVRASFFLLGRHVEANPLIARAVVASGHEVGHHTRDHTHAWRSNPLRAARDLAAGVRIAGEIGGASWLFRPPYGKMTLGTMFHAMLSGLRFGWWTVDSQDSWRPRPIEDILSEINVKRGGVVLMHDFDNYPCWVGGAGHEDYVIDLTRRTLELAAREGLRVVPLSGVGYCARPRRL